MPSTKRGAGLTEQTAAFIQAMNIVQAERASYDKSPTDGNDGQ